jgi:N-methylhydantoinase B
LSACAPIPGTQIVEAIQLALAQAVPEQVPACWSRHVCPILFGKERNIKDPRTGAPRLHWICSFNTDGSSGAICGYDGWNGLGSEVLLGAALRAPIEIDEHKTPWRYGYLEFETDSAGDGEWRGGMGTRCQYINTHNPQTFRPGDQGVMTGNGDGERWTHFGLMGGTDGYSQEMWITRKGEKIRLRTIDILDNLEAGDIISTSCGGGGGVGDSLNRPIEKVRMDVLNEFISLKKAKDVYGVIIDPETFEIDPAATNRQRGKLRKAKKS